MIARIRFGWTYKTMTRKAVDPSDPKAILIFRKGAVARLARHCPHQGAPLDKYSYFEGDDLVCSWHGCRFKCSDVRHRV